MFTERPESNVLRRSVRKSFNTLIVSPSLTPEVEEISFANSSSVALVSLSFLPLCLSDHTDVELF